MNRREILAGAASVGVLGGGAAVLRRGLPFGDRGGPGSESESGSGATGERAETDSGDADDASEPIELEVVESSDVDAATLPVPNDELTLVMFFSPVCSRCRALMPNLANARERLVADHGDRLTVVSVTAHQEPDQLRDWWADNDGTWTLAYDSDRDLTERYDAVTHPILMAIDETGAVRWENEGILEPERIVREVEGVLEAVDGDAAADSGADADDDGSSGNSDTDGSSGDESEN